MAAEQLALLPKLELAVNPNIRELAESPIHNLLLHTSTKILSPALPKSKLNLLAVEPVVIEVKSDLVKPSRISESPINFECKVNDIITLGDEGGAGNLVLAQILKIHIDKSILDVNEDIDPFKLNIVSRYGGDWYGKTTKDSLYKIAKPISKVGMGVDRLPNSIKNSSILSGSDLAILASIEEVPIKNDLQSNTNRTLEEKHILAKQFLKEGNALEAWKILL